MHGRPRKAYKPEEEAASAAKAVKLRSLQNQFMSNHHAKIYTKEAIDLSTKLLEINPEAYTAWNYRKLAVEDALSREESNQDLVKSVLDEELKVVESALRQNFKSYGAWHHRKWVLSKGHSSVGNELRLLDKFQTLDSRNFHAWNYRRFVVELTNRSKEDELKYTEDMISKDFSNYSAWHNRSVLLSSLLAKAEGFMPNEKIPDEYQLVHDAIFTDEDDQSGWFYHLWLLDQTVNVETPLLTSSWPSHGSCINLSGGAGCLNDSSSSKLTTSCSESGSFPLILYFNQAVGGVSSSTVTVDSELRGNEDLVWEPVSNKNSRVSSVWVARLKYMSSEPCFPKEYTVKVRIGNSPGIVSSRGCNFSTPYEFVFTAHVHDTVREDSQEVAVSWTDGFDIWDAQSKDLNFLVNLDQQMGLKWRQEAIEEEIELFRALSDSKIGKLTLARLLMAKAMISENGVKGVHYEEILELYNDLMVLDSSHYHYYKDEHSVALLHKVTSSTESLSRHLFRYRDMNNSVCLRLNNLSLSRIASVEKLLFVQMLDLSHNELHSTEGLEAMQLLSCLNLSHNRIRSFSALDSLRHLKQLRVLDVSHNNIGEHSVDTTRYLCSSPLSNSEWTEDEVGRQMTSLVTKYWDAYFVLRDLNLKQLDIAGNMIAGDEFYTLVPQVVPTLKVANLEDQDSCFPCPKSFRASTSSTTLNLKPFSDTVMVLSMYAFVSLSLVSLRLHKQSILHPEYLRFGNGLVKSIEASAFPRWISRNNEVRLSFLRAEASSSSMTMITKSCTWRANSLGQEIQADLSDEDEEDLCPVECVTEFRTDDELLRVLEKAKETNTLVVVDFYRPSCGSCKYIEQGFSKLCKQSGDQEAPVIFLKHNVIDEYDEQSEVAERLRIKSVPLFHFYKNGVLLEAFATRDKERIDASIAKYTSSESSSTSD
ncbi:hypothetical protein Bca4012_080277 [Brassica carinata]